MLLTTYYIVTHFTLSFLDFLNFFFLGFFSLYRGLAPTLLGSMPKAGIRFGLNAFFKDKMKDKDGKLTAGKNFVAGLGAGVCEAFMIVAPVETVKTKAIDLNMSFLDTMKYILKNEGVNGVYQGAFATALKQGSNQGLRFMWYNEYKKIVSNDGEKELTPLLRLFGGMSAGCFSTLGNNPFDVVKVCVLCTLFAMFLIILYYYYYYTDSNMIIIFSTTTSSSFFECRLVCKE